MSLLSMILGGIVAGGILLGAGEAHAQTANLPIAVDTQLGSLKTVPTPAPDSIKLSQFIRNQDAAVALGKALFWDQQIGSDGQACASCHFNAGADNRAINQLNPGFRAVPQDNAFTPPFGANYQLGRADFPFHRLANPDDRLSAVLFDTNDIASSQGVSAFLFDNINLGNPNDSGTTVADPVFRVGPTPTIVRRVEPRNTPSVINAVFNFRNFWDGRARNEFNGVDPIGDLNPFARVLDSPTPGTLDPVRLIGTLRLENSSLASQAVGPPLSNLEMSFDGRTFPKLGKKVMSLTMPLALQRVHRTDSVLGAMSRALTGGVGLQCGAPFAPGTCAAGTPIQYQQMIQAAFQPRWWQSKLVVQMNGVDTHGAPVLTFVADNGLPLGDNQFRQIQYNFSLFFGLAVQAYESTLRSDQTPFDAFMEGNATALTAQQQLGLRVFAGKGKCIACHSGPEFTNASVRNVQQEMIERMVMGNDQVAVYDNGFYNTAVRRCVGAVPGQCDDLGVGATIGPLDLPLSFSRRFQMPDKIAEAPRIRARLPESAFELTLAASLLPAGNPARTAAEAAIAQANALFTANPPDPVGANAALVLANNGLAAVAAPPTGLLDLLAAATSLLADPLNPGAPPNLFGPLLHPNERVAVDGAFKTPGLRNIELTAPYFHNGGDRTLVDVVNFYNRGGNFPEFDQDNLDPNVVRLGLTDAEKDALVAFLLSLTDERVRHDAAPFDHPSLQVFNGHPCTSRTGGACNDIPAAARTTINGVAVASDVTFELAETGVAGTATPQKTFDQVLGGALLP